MAKKQKLGVAYMTREQFEERLRGVAKMAGEVMESDWWPTLIDDAIDSAEYVEGGFCYAEIMAPWARWLLGDDWFEIADLDTYPQKISV